MNVASTAIAPPFRVVETEVAGVDVSTGARLAIAAAATPGIARTRRSASAATVANGCPPVSAGSMSKSNAISRSRAMPRSAWVSRSRLRAKSMAPDSRTTASAICAVTRTRRVRAMPRSPALRTPLPRACAPSAWRAIHAAGPAAMSTPAAMPAGASTLNIAGADGRSIRRDSVGSSATSAMRTRAIA